MFGIILSIVFLGLAVADISVIAYSSIKNKKKGGNE